jgi:hypothetical protein
MQARTSPAENTGSNSDRYDNIDTFIHDCRNRIGALKLTLHVLKRKSAPDTHDIIEDASAQIADLNDMLASLDRPRC